jgi:hypothetical protein
MLIKEEVRTYIRHLVEKGGKMGIITFNKSENVIDYASFNLVNGDIFNIQMMNEVITMNFILSGGKNNLIGLWVYSDVQRGTPTVESINICKIIMDNCTNIIPSMLLLTINPINETNLFILNKFTKKEVLIPHKKYNKKGVYYDITLK